MVKFQTLTAGLIIALAVSGPIGAVEFTEVQPSESGLSYHGETWGASWGDFNGDRYPDIYVSNHRARPSIWRNNGDGTFTDIVLQFDTSYTWLDNPFLDTHGGAWGDFDNDGVQDLLVATGSVFDSQLFVNEGVGVAVNETDVRTVPDDREGRTPMWWDYDGDGLLDILFANGAPNIVANQSSGSFTDTTSIVGLNSQRANYGIISDVDLDNSMELFAVPDGDFPRAVYKTNTIPFLDVTSTQPFSGLVIDGAFADFNNDLTPDILLIRGSLRPNQALKVTDGDVGEPDKIETWMDGGFSSGERGFTFQSTGPITITVHSTIGYPRYYIGSTGYNPNITTTFTLDPSLVSDHGILPHDELVDQGFYFGYDTVNAQWQVFMSPGGKSTRGYLEIEGVDMTDPVLTNVRTGDLPINPKLFLNDGVSYTDTSGIGLSFPISCVSTAVGDFDNDMDQDIYMVCRNGIENITNRLYVNQGDGTFQEAASFGAEGVTGVGLEAAVGVGENVTTADYDVDGWLDLFVLNGLLMNPLRVGGPDQLFRNTSFNTSTNRWLLLDLVGTVSNRDAIGAKVIVTAGGVSQLREQNGNYHRWSQNHMRLHVGLGQNDTADIEVRWPNGDVDVYMGVSANNLYEITQGLSGNQTGSLATVSPTATPPFPLAQPGDECGVRPENQPANFPFSFDSSKDRGIFIWKDCAGTNEWFIRASSGGGSGVEYTGSLISNGTFSSVTGFQLEVSNDVLDDSVQGIIDFHLAMSGSGVDGFNAVFDGGASACLNMSLLPSNTSVFLGKGHKPVSTPIDLTNLEPCIDVAAEDIIVNEGDGTVDITLNLSSSSATEITVDYSLIDDTALDGSDFIGGAGTVTFAPGEVTATFQFSLIDDALFEETEMLFVELSNGTGAYILDSQSVVTIEDDETCVECGKPDFDRETEQGLFVWKDFSTDVWHVNSTGGGDSDGIFYTGFVSSTAPFASVTPVNIEASDTLDFTTNPDVIDYEMRIWFSGEDGFEFLPEVGALTCFNPTGPSGIPVYVGENRTLMTGAFDLGTLGPCLEVTVADVSVGEGDGVASFIVELSAASVETVSVDYTTSAGTATADVDYSEVSTVQTLTFAAGETQKTVDIPVIQDTLNEAAETFTLNLSNPVNTTIGSLTAVATIVDDEINACGQPSFDSATEKALFVWEDCASGEWFVYGTGGGDLSGVFYDGEVTTSSGFNSVTEFRMEPNDTADNVTDPNVIDFFLKVWNRDLDAFHFVPATKIGACLALNGPAGVPILAGANKLPLSSPFDLSTLGACSSVVVDISIDDIQVSEADTEAVFTVSLSSASGNVVTVDYVTLGDTATGDEDYIEVSTPTTITFNPGELQQQIVIPLLQDALSEDVTETFTVELSSATNAALIDSSGVADIYDDEISSCGKPTYDAGVDQNIYIWRDCGSNNWHLAATAGGSPDRVTYQGEFVSSAAITGLILNSIEANDIVDSNPDAAILDFTNFMRNSGFDGFDFTVDEGASTCLTVDPSSNGGGAVIVGAAQTLFTAPFDLSTLGSCQ